jgi:cell wall-associated NlpC family hydrolase
MHRLKPPLAAVLGLVLSATVAHAEPLSTDDPQPPAELVASASSDCQNLAEPGLAALGEAAGKIGDVLSTGAQALGSGMHHVSDQATVLLEYAQQSIGIRYRWGGTSARTGFDCSGFVRAIVQQTVGKLLPHHAADQAAVTQKISKDELKPGDLVFFNTVRRGAYSHVGIYMGDGQFIHAPSRRERVRISSLSANYWQKHFGGARRVLTDQPDYSLAEADANTRDDITGNASYENRETDTKVADAGSHTSPTPGNTSVFDTPSPSAVDAAMQPVPGSAAEAPQPDLDEPSASTHYAAKYRHTRRHSFAHRGSRRGKPKE